MPSAASRLLQRAYEHSVTPRFWVGSDKIARWAQTTHLFFVLGMGRSGTSFFASLLDKDPNAYVVHEPVRRDFEAYKRAFHSQAEADLYIRRFRSKEIFLRGSRARVPVYGEINSVLRRHVHGLRKAFPSALFLHLVRDGRDVVRSMMARATMTPEDPYTASIRPVPHDPWHDDWPDMDRFARLCWYWATENAYVRGAIGRTVRFEDLLADYESFSKGLLEPCGVKVSPEQWAAAAGRPRNRTTHHELPDIESWSESLHETFETICGEEMRANGYGAA